MVNSTHICNAKGHSNTDQTTSKKPLGTTVDIVDLF